MTSENWGEDGNKYFQRSELACRCCDKIFIDGRLLRALNELRELADAPIKVTCAYRCVKHNSEIGGEKASYHCSGKAADLTIKGFTVQEAFKLAEQIPAFLAGGIGLYPAEGFLHVDVRNGKARWARIKRGGPYVDIKDALKEVVK